MSPLSYKLTITDLLFLKNLDNRVRQNREISFRSSPRSNQWESGTIKDYSKKKITSSQMQKLLEIVKKRDDVAFIPINTSMGFSVGYKLAQIETTFPGAPPNTKELVVFREDQIPEGYTWESLSEYFLSETNLRNVEILGERVVNDRNHYIY